MFHIKSLIMYILHFLNLLARIAFGTLVSWFENWLTALSSCEIR